MPARRLPTRWAALLLLSLGGCSKPTPPPELPEALATRSQQPTAESVACATCHRDVFDEWVGSQHANAQRLVSDALDRAAFDPASTIHHGSFVTSMRRTRRGAFEFTTAFSNQAPEVFRAVSVIGVTPLRQYLVPFPGGRLQVQDTAYDPRHGEWFHVFGNEDRQPHEWGHWKGRSMTWNAQCAFCHMTGFEKRYDPQEDRYESTWQAMGIGCAQCHGDMEEHAATARRLGPADLPLTPRPADPDRLRSVMENCASCHARREELSDGFRPGARFEDHYRIALPDQPGVFYADGQVRDEDFEYASFLLSRMGHRGVNCLDCHDPHTGGLVAPAENNALCLQCHAPPGTRQALPIHPVAHSFHAAGTPGSRCVDCHMPENTYMVRDPRRDHGFTSPDPRLTIEFGIPNACNRCHTNQTPEWAESWTTKWYGPAMERRARERARAVARYHQSDPNVGSDLLAMARTEEIDAWRAALVAMLQPWAGQPEVSGFLASELQHQHPRVRSAAVVSLTTSPAPAHLFTPLLADTFALVRLDAAAALHARGALSGPAHEELVNYLNHISDQPAGALRQAQHALAEARPRDAEAWARKAVAWDPTAVPHHMLGRILHLDGRMQEALPHLRTAAELAPTQSEFAYTLALALAENGDASGALQWLEETTRRTPHFGRGWYNLGLAYAAAGRAGDAIDALGRAERLLEHSADAAYAAATVLLNRGEPDQAAAALGRALEADPTHAPSLSLLRQLERQPSATPPGPWR